MPYLEINAIFGTKCQFMSYRDSIDVRRLYYIKVKGLAQGGEISPNFLPFLYIKARFALECNRYLTFNS